MATVTRAQTPLMCALRSGQSAMGMSGTSSLAPKPTAALRAPVRSVALRSRRMSTVVAAADGSSPSGLCIDLRGASEELLAHCMHS